MFTLDQYTDGLTWHCNDPLVRFVHSTVLDSDRCWDNWEQVLDTRVALLELWCRSWDTLTCLQRQSIAPFVYVSDCVSGCGVSKCSTKRRLICWMNLGDSSRREKIAKVSLAYGAVKWQCCTVILRCSEHFLLLPAVFQKYALQTFQFLTSGRANNSYGQSCKIAKSTTTIYGACTV